MNENQTKNNILEKTKRKNSRKNVLPHNTKHTSNDKPNSLCIRKRKLDNSRTIHNIRTITLHNNSKLRQTQKRTKGTRKQWMTEN